MDLYELINKLDKIDTITEADAMALPAPQQDPKPTMSVNMNAQGDSIKELLQILSNLESDVEGLDRDSAGDHDMSDHEMEAYANEPNVDEKDIDYMLHDLSGGMNGPKKTYDVVSKGDNPMQKAETKKESIKRDLEQKLKEFKEI